MSLTYFFEECLLNSRGTCILHYLCELYITLLLSKKEFTDALGNFSSFISLLFVPQVSNASFSCWTSPVFACVVVWPLCSLFKTKTLFPSAVVFFSRSSVIRDVSGLDAKLSLPTFDMKNGATHSKYHPTQWITIVSSRTSLSRLLFRVNAIYEWTENKS